MFEYLLDEKTRRWRDEVRDFVKSIPRQMILDMDADKIRFPKEFLQEAGRRNLLGCRYPKRWGGREMDWVSTCVAMEEVGTLGYIFACTFGVGAELVCDAIVLHGTDAQKERYVAPLLRGEIFAAECLTEPRGGSDFFGTTTTAVDRGDHFVLNGQKRFIVGKVPIISSFTPAPIPRPNPMKASPASLWIAAQVWKPPISTGSWAAAEAAPAVWFSETSKYPRKMSWVGLTAALTCSKP